MSSVAFITTNLFAVLGTPSGTEILEFEKNFEYSAAHVPDSNPVKGFVGYPGSWDFPHSMEYSYFGFADLMPEKNSFRFQEVLDPFLEQVAGRGNQAIVRIYLDYPNDSTSVPQFLIDAGVSLTPYEEHGGGLSPDYDHPAVVDATENLVQKFGELYDGDPRLAYVQVGILGHWGEWHTWPNHELFASYETQSRVLQVFSESFDQTPLLVSQDSFSQTPVHDYSGYGTGFHDDAFTEGTLGPDEWMFVPRLTRFNFLEHWKKFPVGGEVLPSLQSVIWDIPSGSTQDYTQCIQVTHATWLLNHAAFSNSWDEAKRQRALTGSKHLGYDLFLRSFGFKAENNTVTVRLEIQNFGVAPYYGDWPVKVSFEGTEPHEKILELNLGHIFPDTAQVPFVYEESWNVEDLADTLPASFSLEVIRPDSRLKPFMFSNPGYLDGILEIKAAEGGI